MAVIVNTVYGDYEKYPGVYIWLGQFCFAFQLYSPVFQDVWILCWGCPGNFWNKASGIFERVLSSQKYFGVLEDGIL